MGTSYIDWLKKNFSWLFAAAQSNATLGQSYVYADEQLPSYAMLGEYGNGAASGSARLEYIWLPTEDGQALPIGLYRSNRFFAIHSDHLNTPRLITDDANKAVWQWPYSAFGDNKPTGILKATANPNNALTQDPASNARLQATNPNITYNPRFPGQYFDSETGLHQNYFRSYRPQDGRYTQNDLIELEGGDNRFVYANQNALMFIDTEGLLFMTTVGGLQRGTLDQAVAQGTPGTVAAGLGLGVIGAGAAVGVVGPAGVRAVAMCYRALEKNKDICSNAAMAAVLGASICGNMSGTAKGSARSYARDRERIEEVGNATARTLRRNTGTDPR